MKLSPKKDFPRTPFKELYREKHADIVNRGFEAPNFSPRAMVAKVSGRRGRRPLQVYARGNGAEHKIIAPAYNRCDEIFNSYSSLSEEPRILFK